MAKPTDEEMTEVLDEARAALRHAQDHGYPNEYAEAIDETLSWVLGYGGNPRNMLPDDLDP